MTAGGKTGIAGSLLLAGGTTVRLLDATISVLLSTWLKADGRDALPAVVVRWPCTPLDPE
jgi:hypothetical protein